MVDQMVGGTREKVMAGWSKWKPRAQVVWRPMAESMVGGARVEIAAQPLAMDPWDLETQESWGDDETRWYSRIQRPRQSQGTGGLMRPRRSRREGRAQRSWRGGGTKLSERPGSLWHRQSDIWSRWSRRDEGVRWSSEDDGPRCSQKSEEQWI